MSHSDDHQGGKKKPQDSPPEPTESDKRSGRVSFDSKGNPVWEWQLETGVYSRDVTTQKLKKLDLGDLSIADSGIHPQPANPQQRNAPARTGASPSGNDESGKDFSARDPSGKHQAGKPQRSAGGGGFNPGFNPCDSSTTGTGNRNLGGGGFNPYDSSGRAPPGAGSNPYDTARALGNRFNPEPAPEPRRRTPADLRKLDAEIKAQRKKLEE